MTALATSQTPSLFKLQEMIQQQKALIEAEQEIKRAESEKERYFLVFAVQLNKGAAICKRVQNVISAQKLGSNLRHFMSSQGRYFDRVELSEVPAIAAEFQKYWLGKMNPDSELATAIGSEDGRRSIINYIGSEVLRERHRQGKVCDEGVAFALGLGALAKEGRNSAHEAINKGFREAGKALHENIKSFGLRLDSRQIGAIDAIIQSNIHRAVKQIEDSTLRRYDELESRMNALIHDAGTPALGSSSGKESH